MHISLPVDASACQHRARRNGGLRDPDPPGKACLLSGELGTSAGIDLQDVADRVTAQVMRQLGLLQPGPCSLSHDLAQELVFVICPFDPEMDPVFEAIAAAAAANGLRAERVKDVQGDYRITDKMLTLLRQARLVVADLSRERPNVYFELGYARGLGKTVITILRAGTTAHFDVRDWTYLEYIDSRPLEHDLRERFRFELTHSAELADQ